MTRIKRFFAALPGYLLLAFPPYWIYLLVVWAMWPTAKARRKRDIRRLILCLAERKHFYETKVRELRSTAKVTDSLLDKHPEHAERIQEFLGEEGLDSYLADELQRKVDGLGRLIRVFEDEHLPGMDRTVGYIPPETFASDLETAQTLLQSTLPYSFGVISVPMRLLLAFGVARVAGYGLAWCAYGTRSMMLRCKMGGLMRRIDRIKDLSGI